jgi:hypothetical protein
MENCRPNILFQVRVVISSAFPHSQLFLSKQQEDFTDEDRKLMDDLNIQHGSVRILLSHASYSVLTP